MLPFDFFIRSAQRYPDNPAILHGEVTLTYRELAVHVLKLAALLVELDPIKQTRVAIGAKNSIEHIIGILAVLASGKIWVPVNPRNGDTEIKRGIDITEPSIVLFDGEMNNRIKTNAKRQLLIDIADADSTIGRSARLEPLRETLEVSRADDIQAIKFTGGTSGTPKGSMQSYRCWNTMIVSQLHAFRFQQDDRFLVSTPLTHGASTYLLPLFSAGGANVIPVNSTPAGIVDAIKANQITTMFMPPTQLTAVVDYASQNDLHAGSLRRVIYGAAPMRPDRIRQAQDVLGPIIAATYGQTEAPQVISVISAKELIESSNLTSVGRPGLLTKVAIKGSDGNLAGIGEQGEILVRGDLVMNGYWRLPELSAETIVDGWLHTGDIGFFDERGYLFLRDRSREIIITGGFNVYPSDVETALSRHAAVAHCAVFGIPDEKWGEAVHGAVELRPGHRFDPDEVLRALKTELGSVQAPKFLHVVDSLPRSPVGKILKNEIRARILQSRNSGES